MVYVLTLGGEEHRAEIEELGPGRYRIALDGTTHEVDSRHTSKDIRSFIVGGEVFEADFEDSNGELAFLLDGRKFHIHAIDERRQRLRKAAELSAGDGEVATPMPGKVIRILAPVGTAVKAGQGVVVLEAMKMENEMTSPVDGTVSEIRVEEGQAVEADTVLAIVDADSEDDE